MLLVPIASTDIAAAGYDPDGMELQIQYTTGRIYSYQNITPDWYQQFLNMPSKGSFLAQTVRKFPSAFPYTRIL